MAGKRKYLYAAAALLILGLLLFVGSGQIRKLFFTPTGSSVETGSAARDNTRDIEVIATNLTVPWGVAFLPGGDMLVTERSGMLRRIGEDKQSHAIEGVTHVGEGGLLGVAVDPKFVDNGQIYLYMTTRTDDALTNRIERYSYAKGRLADRKAILGNIPGEVNHDGGRIAFGPDGFLYVATGDAGKPELAQDKDSLAGKILRLTAEGKPAPGNPFGNAVYSFGHRNPQGLAWDDKGRLWSTEHGPSGSGSGYDELNLIKPGGKYGWPVIKGDEAGTGMVTPIVHSGRDETWAPAGLAYAEGSLFFGGLRGQTLYEAKLTGNDSVSLKAHFRNEYGRIRTTAVRGSDLYVTTSNTDGRGNPNAGDDKLVRMKLSLFP